MFFEVIDGGHNYLEGTIQTQELMPIIEHSFPEGKTGVWESAGSWLRKLCLENPAFQTAWEKLADHKSANVRYRVVCHLNEISEPTKIIITNILLKDKSKKASSMTEARGARFIAG